MALAATWRDTLRSRAQDLGSGAQSLRTKIAVLAKPAWVERPRVHFFSPPLFLAIERRTSITTYGGMRWTGARRPWHFLVAGQRRPLRQNRYARLDHMPPPRSSSAMLLTPGRHDHRPEVPTKINRRSGHLKLECAPVGSVPVRLYRRAERAALFVGRHRHRHQPEQAQHQRVLFTIYLWRRVDDARCIS